MRHGTTARLGAILLLALALPALAEETSVPPAAGQPAASQPAPQPETVLARQARARLAALDPATPEKDRERLDRQALAAFYADQGHGPLWTAGGALNGKARSLLAELAAAEDYGLTASAFEVPAATASAKGEGEAADLELQLSAAALLYARHARGGRIADPTAMLNSNLDRRPQWLEPGRVLDELAAAGDVGAYLRGLNPRHPQFERLRQLYLAERARGQGKAALSPAAKRLRANMEMWRWMNEDMGALHVLNNIPEFMQYVYKDGRIIRSERIVAGEVGKQSSIFSRPLKYVVLRPMWRVPESIKVNELWPSLLRGGGYMRKYGLELQTKAGEPVDWRRIDWTKDDIRNYEVVQPPGPKSVLGRVKFSFPSQHTIYMHDTPDKWMFKPARRTLSHGCLRVRNPMELAEIILREDKGWDADRIAELDRSGPLNNEIPIEKRIPIHLVYFTAWVDDQGKLRTFADVYGHEKRVILALDGNWERIDKGRDHLAPVEVKFNPAAVAAKTRPGQAQSKSVSLGDILSEAFGLDF